MTTGKSDFYLYDETRKDDCFSVSSVVDVLSIASNQVDIPASEQRIGETFSVCGSGDGSAYRWLKPTGRRFAEIFITVTAAVRHSIKAAKRFVRLAVHRVRMSLTVRKTICLRL